MSREEAAVDFHRAGDHLENWKVTTNIQETKENLLVTPVGLLGPGCLRNGAKQGWLHVKYRLWVTAIHPESSQDIGKRQGGKGYSEILFWIALGTNPALIFITHSANDLNKLRKARAHILTASLGKFLPLLLRSFMTKQLPAKMITFQTNECIQPSLGTRLPLKIPSSTILVPFYTTNYFHTGICSDLFLEISLSKIIIDGKKKKYRNPKAVFSLKDKAK